jgi:N-acetylglucosaminyldiphosphoundecaprenol N-acetyl-beta-D-mannosaminyltransferase
MGAARRGTARRGAAWRGTVDGSGARRARQVITLNPEMLYSAWQNSELRKLLNQGDLVVADGYGIVWAAARLGHPLPERVAGIDLIQSLATRASISGWRFFLLGGEPGVAEAAADSLRRQHPGLAVVGARHGFFTPAETPSVLEQIRAAGPDLLLVGLGFPKQERFIRDHRRELGALVAVGVGGSFDVLSGRLCRSPLWMRRLRLEWLYRACQEPARWRRLMVLPLFVLQVLTAGWNKKTA